VRNLTWWHWLTIVLLGWCVGWFVYDLFVGEYWLAVMQLFFVALAMFWFYNVWSRGRNLWGDRIS
jgi:hypothetical protein